MERAAAALLDLGVISGQTGERNPRQQAEHSQPAHGRGRHDVEQTVVEESVWREHEVAFALADHHAEQQRRCIRRRLVVELQRQVGALVRAKITWDVIDGRDVAATLLEDLEAHDATYVVMATRAAGAARRSGR